MSDVVWAVMALMFVIIYGIHRMEVLFAYQSQLTLQIQTMLENRLNQDRGEHSELFDGMFAKPD